MTHAGWRIASSHAHAFCAGEPSSDGGSDGQEGDVDPCAPQRVRRWLVMRRSRSHRRSRTVMPNDGRAKAPWRCLPKVAASLHHPSVAPACSCAPSLVGATALLSERRLGDRLAVHSGQRDLDFSGSRHGGRLLYATSAAGDDSSAGQQVQRMVSIVAADIWFIGWYPTHPGLVDDLTTATTSTRARPATSVAPTRETLL